MRRLSLLSLLVGIALVPFAYGVASNDHDRHLAEIRRTVAAQADSHAADLDAYFLRARSVILLTANQPPLQQFDDQRGTRLQKLRAGGTNIGYVTGSLHYLERLYPTSIGEVCFIDRTGAEAARVVRGRVAPRSQLSTTEQSTPFFRPTFALLPGEVYQARPYVSPDTGEWVIANSTLTPSRDGAKRSIVHFEVTIESFRRAMGTDEDYELRVVDASTGGVVVQGDRRQRVGAPLGVPGDRRFASIALGPRASGIRTVDGRPTAYRRVHRATGNANDWLLVATAVRPPPSLVRDSGLATIAMLVLALALAIVGAIGLRAQRRDLLSAAQTDILTGLPNRRRLIQDLERRVGRSQTEPAVLVLLDLNGFKGYNDSFGHLAGDALLQRLGHALAESVAALGRAYRLGGDEFCVLAEVASSAEIEAVARGALHERGEGFDIAAASGAVLMPAEAHTAHDALRLADQRMYATKVSGRAGAERHTMDVLVRVLAERHPSLGDHSDGVAELAEDVARHLGLAEHARAQVRHAAELHDIGKVAIPDTILEKPGPLDDDEWAFMRRHTLIGERILAGAPALAPIAELVRSSHERYDGTGYPDGLAGEDIPLGARVIAVCDAFDAMLGDRPYSPPCAVSEALTELRRCAGDQFDPVVVEAFAAVLEARSAPLHR